MQYTKPSFTVPPAKVSQAEWDRIFKAKKLKRRTRPARPRTAVPPRGPSGGR